MERDRETVWLANSCIHFSAYYKSIEKSSSYVINIHATAPKFNSLDRKFRTKKKKKLEQNDKNRYEMGKMKNKLWF